MDPFHGRTLLAITSRPKGIRTPRQMALNLTVLPGPVKTLFPGISGSHGVSIKKGPLIAGFHLFSSRISIIDPFDWNDKKVTDSGVKSD